MITLFPARWLPHWQKYSISVATIICAISAALWTTASYAVTIADLQRSNDIEIKAWLAQNSDDTSSKQMPSFSVNEQVILNIEVATPRWFTGGTRIESVEIPSVIAKQRNQLATNYTERKEGATWSRQRWEITLYPVKSGSYSVPSLAVNVQVSAPDGSSVAGTLYTQPLAFNVSLPSGLLSEDTPWFTATNVEVKQEWQQSSEKLKVGDAITRKVTIRAQDSLSVLLPNLLTREASDYFQGYPQPHRLEDSQTRGNYQSSRVEETVYVIQQGGDFSFPEHRFQWWNAKTNQLETVTVSGKQFHAQHTPASFVKANLNMIATVVSTIVIVLATFLLGRRHYRTHPRPPWLLFWLDVRGGKWAQARTQLYRQLRLLTNQLEMSKARGATTEWVKISGLIQSGDEKAQVFMKMWRLIRAQRQSAGKLKLPKALSKLDEVHKAQQ